MRRCMILVHPSQWREVESQAVLAHEVQGLDERVEDIVAPLYPVLIEKAREPQDRSVKQFLPTGPVPSGKKSGCPLHCAPESVLPEIGFFLLTVIVCRIIPSAAIDNPDDAGKERIEHRLFESPGAGLIALIQITWGDALQPLEGSAAHRNTSVREILDVQ